MRCFLAIDIGASSGRHILASLENGKMSLTEMHRFENRQIIKNGHRCWDIDHLWENILLGLKKCGRAGKIPESVGIDTWAVDFMLLDENKRVLTDAVCYRDSRTEGMNKKAEQSISPEALYVRTGIAYQPFNTLYQLLALQKESPEVVAKAAHFLMIPEFFSFLLTGNIANEYTNASSTNLLDAVSKDWDRELLETLGLPTKIFSKPVAAGHTLGTLLPEIKEAVGFDTKVILPATHDTGSAYFAVPARDSKTVFLSSGTWSLMGVENQSPITTPESLAAGFTNEGGVDCYRYLKNIMGLWMLQSVRKELGGTPFPELIKMAEACKDFSATVNCNAARFLAPDSMIRAVKEQCAEEGQPVPETDGEVVACIYNSLAACYRKSILELEALTDTHYTALHIVGGGCQDEYLAMKTKIATGLRVFTGPVEATAIGNLLVQMLAAGEIKNRAEGKQMIENSFEIKEILL